jgi:hypothetical protein
MTATGDFFMGRDSHDLRGRLASYLRKQYQGHGAKRLANDIGCTPKTAENILGGHWPRAEHLASIVRHFRRDVVDAVFGPEIDETVSRLQQEVRDLERQLAAKRAHLRESAGDYPSTSRGASPHETVEQRTFGGEP